MAWGRVQNGAPWEGVKIKITVENKRNTQKNWNETIGNTPGGRGEKK